MLRRAAVLVVLASAAFMPCVQAAEPGKETPVKSADMTVPLRSQKLVRNAEGYTVWQVRTEERKLAPAETALVLCDVWDKHWCRGANERLAALLPRMNQTVNAARAMGVTIIHAPSETMDFYKDAPARKRVQEAPKAPMPEAKPRQAPGLPIDDSDGGSDTGEKSWHKAWKSQNPAIEIDQAKDGISDNGQEIWNFLQARGLKNVLILGVHTNMCILNRSFAIKAMVERGVNVALVRDLTDTMYNPARSPYVSHEEGTRLVVEYIEKFWCPTITSEDLARAAK
jgi:nicotinamidase-related amidase